MPLKDPSELEVEVRPTLGRTGFYRKAVRALIGQKLFCLSQVFGSSGRLYVGRLEVCFDEFVEARNRFLECLVITGGRVQQFSE